MAMCFQEGERETTPVNNHLVYVAGGRDVLGPPPLPFMHAMQAEDLAPLSLAFVLAFAPPQEIRKYQNDMAEVERLKDLFKRTADTVYQIWGPHACM